MNISTLEAFVEQHNRWQAIFNGAQLSLLRAEDRQKIADELDMALSPENLSCDGELTAHQVRIKHNRLMRCVAELRSIDPNVEMWEA
jgi:hypothetical protein